MNRVVLICIALIALTACEFDNSDEKVLPTSSGKYGEVLVVVDSTYEKQATGEVLREIFFKAVKALPQQEPMFRMSTVAPFNFKSILKRSRNILRVTIKGGAKNKLVKRENVWAKNQLLIELTAASDQAAAKLLEENKAAIRSYFNQEEIDRLQKQFSIKPQEKLMNTIENQFSISITIPPAYLMMDSTAYGLWLKKEQQVGKHILLQGIMIYELPYESDSVFSIEKMINSRNEFCKTHIQGVRENSYMAVYEEFEPIVEEINLNGLYAVAYSGLWNMENDFMGGPFIHYSFVDEQRQKVIHADGFVYAPKFNKREYVRELKAILQTIKLTDEK